MFLIPFLSEINKNKTKKPLNFSTQTFYSEFVGA